MYLSRSRYIAAIFIAWAILPRLGGETFATTGGTVVRFDTVEGSFLVELYDEVMPRTVANFLGYVNTARYDGSVVHRNSDTEVPFGSGNFEDFVIQGGGFFLQDPTPPNNTITFSNVATDPPINDEPGGGVTGPSNVRGTIAMAKSGPNTVTSQWFFNQRDNSFLDDPNRGDGGFGAFGEVLHDGMEVVDRIGDLPLPPDFGFSIGAPFNDLPLRNFNGNDISDIRVENTVVVSGVYVFADFNHNTVVTGADLAILERHYGTTDATFNEGNSDADGDVDGKDFLRWQRTAGMFTPPPSPPSISAVPEPTTALLAACGLASATATCCRRGAVAPWRRKG